MMAWSGLPAYLDLASVARFGGSVRRHVGVREGTKRWSDAQMVTALVMLILAGWESVDDVRVLEKDEGLGKLLLEAETHGMWRAECRATGVPGRGATPCRRLRRCSGIWTASTTRARSPGDDRAELSYRRPTTRCAGLLESTRTWSGSRRGPFGHTEMTLDPGSSTGQAMDATLI